ncbi:hypothetical protein TRFO_28680 [Tritrichomonas foetus]|uniref:TNFR-Cys domain-containing protein n=1 Tax=Tritrichomonas foetus TaxID=1144522 RepID=A0A1J4JY86_9EUKA|nr:hypothetical protein TRFO_28680 [Tritrichomonas foetus]|eukprot:OHT03955.1 hypothetical protein TRFO_28680 [Tritrichomonas foetus]
MLSFPLFILTFALTPMIKSDTPDESSPNFVNFQNGFICDISVSSISLNSSSLFCNNSQYTVDANQNVIKVIGSSNSTSNVISKKISIFDATTTLILENTKIEANSAFTIESSTVFLFISGDSNSIISHEDAAILCSDSYIQIMNATSTNSDKLILKSDKYSGIGGGQMNKNCRGIYIYGGKIKASGGQFGAGIGGGLGSQPNSAGVDNIEIVDGEITAIGGEFGAGIGGGKGQTEGSSSVASIKLYGGSVNAVGGINAAGIGGGYGNASQSSNIELIEIFGGNISATGGTYGAGIGGGYSFNEGSSASVKLINLYANTIINNSIDNKILCTNIHAIRGDKAQKGIGNGRKGLVFNITEKGSTIECNGENKGEMHTDSRGEILFENKGEIHDENTSEYLNGNVCTFNSEEGKCIQPWKCSSSNPQHCPSCSTPDCNETNPYCICKICNNGFSLSSGDFQCIKCKDEHCKLCAESFDTCTSCENGFSLSGGKCIKCSPIDNCLAHNEQCRCSRCSPGYTLTSDSMKCNQCDFQTQHCYKYYNECICDVCESGYSLSSGVCIQCADPNCEKCDNFNFCSKCLTGYEATIEGKCIKCYIPFCLTYNESFCSCIKFLNRYSVSLEGKCDACIDPHCIDCSNNRSECSQCSAGYNVDEKTNQCMSCNVPNCLAYSTGCLCSNCEGGYHIENNFCILNPTPTPNLPRIDGILFCTTSKEINLCNELNNYNNIETNTNNAILNNVVNDASWNNQKIKIESFIHNKIKNQTTSISDKYAYNVLLKKIGGISHIFLAFNNSINELIQNLEVATRKLVILQFGSMNSQYYDFSQLIQNTDVLVIPISGYLPNSDSEIYSVIVKGGNPKNLNSLTFLFGSIQITSTLKTNQISFISSILNIDSQSLIIDTHYLSIDSYHASSILRLNSSILNFGVIVPETETKLNTILIGENSIFITANNSITFSFPTKVGKEQFSIISHANYFILKLTNNNIKFLSSPSFPANSLNLPYSLSLMTNSSSLEINTLVNISSHCVNPTFHFDGSEWNSITWNKGIILESESKDSIILESKPQNVKIEIFDIFNEESNGKSPANQKSGISDNAISLIIISTLLVTIILFGSAVFVFRRKPLKKDGRESTTPLLIQPFNDVF